MNFPSRLKALRKSHDLTQIELAHRLGLSKANVSKYEHGIIEPNLATLSLLSELFDVTVDYLLGKTNIPSSSVIDLELSGFDFALYGETKDLTDDEKERILDFIKFTKSQRK